MEIRSLFTNLPIRFMSLNKTKSSLQKKIPIEQDPEQASTFYYVCITCDLLKRTDKDKYKSHQTPTIRVKNNELLNDAESLLHFCHPRTTGEHMAKQVLWQFLNFL